MSDEQDTLTGEITRVKISLLKAAMMMLQGMGFFLGTGLTAFGVTSSWKAALLAGCSAFGGYIVGNLQKTGGFSVSFDGLKKVVPVLALLGAVSLVAGCLTVDEAISIYQGASTNQVIGTVTNIIVPPAQAKACTCDLSKPCVWPLKQHGSPQEVDKWLASGGAAECGASGRRDVRNLLQRPDGRAWGYAPFWSSGALSYNPDGSQVMFKCVAFEGQSYHFLGYSTGEDRKTMIPAKPGEWINYVQNGHGMFTYWECRDP